MKIVIAHNFYVSGVPSGENTIVRAEVEQLREAGLTVLPLFRSSDEIPGLRLTEKLGLAASPFFNGRSSRALHRLLTEEKPDVLHLHNPYPLLSPWVIRTALANRVPVVHTVHNFRQVCVSGLYFRSGADCRACVGRAFGFPAVRYACYRGSHLQSALMAGTLAFHRNTWKSVSRMVALNPTIADHLVDFGVPRDRIVLKPNAIPDPGPPTGEVKGEGFLFAARLNPEKGLSILLEAWMRHEPFALGSLRIAGDGDQRNAVEEAAASRPDITYLGSLPQGEVRHAIREASCVVVPSMWPDVLPTIALEALAAGRPVLGARVGGVPYLVGDAGWIAEPTVESLSSMLMRASSEIRQGRDLQRTARDRYEANFSPQANTSRLIDIYRDVAERA